MRNRDERDYKRRMEIERYRILENYMIHFPKLRSVMEDVRAKTFHVEQADPMEYIRRTNVPGIQQSIRNNLTSLLMKTANDHNAISFDTKTDISIRFPEGAQITTAKSIIMSPEEFEYLMIRLMQDITGVSSTDYLPKPTLYHNADEHTQLERPEGGRNA